MSWRIQRGDGPPTWGAVWIDLGPLRLIRCAGPRPGSPGHPNKWMISWRRRLPEWNSESYARLHRTYPTEEARHEYFRRLFPPCLTEADRRKFGVERADGDEQERVRLLQAFAPLACFQCKHPDAPKARKEIVETIRTIRQRESLPARPQDVPENCCFRQGDR